MNERQDSESEVGTGGRVSVGLGSLAAALVPASQASVRGPPPCSERPADEPREKDGRSVVSLGAVGDQSRPVDPVTGHAGNPPEASETWGRKDTLVHRQRKGSHEWRQRRRQFAGNKIVHSRTTILGTLAGEE